jgi:molecular chaperone GrpE
MIHQKALKVFENNGVKPMEDPSGTEFDVDFHEALMAMPSDKPQNTIVQMVQNGYMIQDKVLRHAKVVTSSGPADED